MKRSIKPSKVNGSVCAPASKSVAQRAIAIASMAMGHSEIISVGESDDVQAAISVCRAMGVNFDILSDRLIISGGLRLPKIPLDCGESGLSVRMFSAIAATLDGEVTLTGKGSLLNRPMDIVEESLIPMGIRCTTNQGQLPILVKGPMQGGIIKVDGSISSQVITGMLIASPYAKRDTTLLVQNLQSQPYIDITLEVMKSFGVDVENKNYSEFFIKAGQRYKPIEYTVEGDWSGAAFMLVAGAIGGRVMVTNLRPNSPQADRVIINALNYAGAKISVYDNQIEVNKHHLKGFDFDATNCPDLFPPLVALASHCEGETRILGVSRLHVKESDRAATLKDEFGKMGIDIRIEGELLIVKGGKPQGANVQSHGDHRIAMATAVAALAGTGDLEIDGAECVSKSYPEFFEELDKVASER
jgi:3-phosphoshikimate 1-carboxyvinyltransferase